MTFECKGPALGSRTLDVNYMSRTTDSSWPLRIGYLVPESTIKVDFYGANPVGIELPQTVDLTVTDTSPAIKGATASAQLKPATLETGLVVQVPPSW